MHRHPTDISKPSLTVSVAQYEIIGDLIIRPDYRLEIDQDTGKWFVIDRALKRLCRFNARTCKMLAGLDYLVERGGLFELSRHFELKEFHDRIEVFYCGRQVNISQSAQVISLGGKGQRIKAQQATAKRTCEQAWREFNADIERRKQPKKRTTPRKARAMEPANQLPLLALGAGLQ